jgi:fatty aldehyde-generating acyl-ACP reductase
VEFHRDIGWQMMEAAEMDNPQRQMFACFAEAMLLDFEDIHTNFSWGRNNITIEKMDLIGKASIRHGFQALGFQALGFQALGFQALGQPASTTSQPTSLAASQPALPS